MYGCHPTPGDLAVTSFGRSFYLPHRGITVAALRRPSLWPLLFVSYCMPRKRKPRRGYKPFVGSARILGPRQIGRAIRERGQREAALPLQVLQNGPLLRRALLPDAPSEFAVGWRHTQLQYPLYGLVRGRIHPALIAPDHLDKLATSPALFARKIDSDIEPEVCRLIDRDFLGIASD